MSEQNTANENESKLNENSSEVDAALDEALKENMENDSVDQRVSQLLAQVEHFRDRELRAQAELENFRKRAARDVEQQIKFSNVAIVRDLLDVVDNLMRAIEAAEGKKESSGLLEGVRLVYQQFLTVLAKFDCKPIESAGKEFDPNLHQAIANIPNEAPAGTVIHQASIGYLMHDRVVRPSQVVVSAGPA